MFPKRKYLSYLVFERFVRIFCYFLNSNSKDFFICSTQFYKLNGSRGFFQRGGKGLGGMLEQKREQYVFYGGGLIGVHPAQKDVQRTAADPFPAEALR